MTPACTVIAMTILSRVSFLLRTRQAKKLSGDLIYTGLSLGLFNAVVNLFVLPYVHYVSGSDKFGNILAWIGLTYIVALPMGNAICNVRLTDRSRNDSTNGDFNALLVFGGLIVSFISVVLLFLRLGPGSDWLPFVFLNIVVMIRMYAEVEFRLSLDFRQYFLYYVTITVGYVFGACLYGFLQNWAMIFLPGELCGILFVMLRGSIFKRESVGPKFAVLARGTLSLFVSYLLTMSVVHGDRVILRNVVGARSLAVYASLSVLAKALYLIGAPIKTVLLSYMSSGRLRFTSRRLMKMLSAWVLVCLVVFLGCLVVAPLYVRIFYPSLFPDIAGLNVLVNGGLILGFGYFLMSSVLLVYGGARVVLCIETVFALSYFVLASLMASKWGITGYAWAVIINRVIRFGLGCYCCFFFVARHSHNREYGG